MSKKNIIIIAAVIAALVIGTVVVMNIDTSPKEQQTKAGETYTVYSADASDIAEVKVTTSEGEIRAVNTGKSEWTINDLPTGEVDPSKAYSLAGTVSTIISRNKYEAPSDLSEYGLDNPALTVVITKKNGDTDKLYVGDLSPTLGEYFIMLDGDDNVYTLYSYKADTLMKPLEYYKEFNRFNVNVDDITGIRIDREDGAVELRIKDAKSQTMANVWEMTEPYKVNANDDYVDNKILAPIECIELANPVDRKITAPITLTLTVKPYDSTTGKYGEEYTEELDIGETEGNVTYVKYKGEVYATSSSSVAFVNENAFNIASKLQALVDIALVKDVTVEYGNESHTIAVAKESGSKYSFKLDGKDTDAEMSQEIYRNIIGIAVDGIYDGNAAGETVLKLTFKGVKNSDGATVEFKKLDDLNCVAVRDGEALFTVKTSKIDEFIKLFDAYVKAHE